MRFSIFAAISALVAVVSADQFTVTVGGNGTLTYNPTSITAKAGDVVSFVFTSKNHTVTESTFAAPCTNKTGGFDSGFWFVQPNATQFASWSITVTNDTAPIWVYCRQANHCETGMVFAINPTAAKSFAAFQAAAMASTPGAASANGTNTTSAPGGATPSGFSTSVIGSPTASGPSGAPSATGSSGALTLGRNAGGLLATIALVVGVLL